MYSPKIGEDLIPRIYRIAKARKRPMTKIVDAALRECVERMEAELGITETGRVGGRPLAEMVKEPRSAGER